MLDHVNIPWAWLKNHLDVIIDEVNQNKPLGSSSIAVDPGTTGTLLSLSRGTGSDSSGGGGGGGEVWPAEVGWQLLTVIDTSSGTCVNKYIYYWGTVAADNPGSPPAMPH